jgi:undecaprenyl-diphosphatase
MSLLEAIVLGLVQGLTEFLPVSSTAHLRLAPELFGWRDPGAAYSAVIQLGTTAAVLVYFARDIARLAAAWVQGLVQRAPFGTLDSRLAWYVGLGTIPIGLAGLTFKRAIETHLRSLYVIALALITLALVLWWVERRATHARGLEQMTLKDGLVVGLWQALALVPGSSRSGTTITGGLLLGLTREAAARYSFLLSIPATLLAGVFELKHLLESSAAERPSGVAMAVGAAVAFASGLAAIAGLLGYLRRRSMAVFIVYRLVLGTLLLVLLAAGVLKPLSGAENLDVPEKPLQTPAPKQVTD